MVCLSTDGVRSCTHVSNLDIIEVISSALERPEDQEL